MKKTGIYLTGVLILLASCMTSEHNGHIQKSNEFENSKKIESSTIENSGIFNVSEWILNDSVLVCLSSKADNLFYILEADSLNVISSFGKKGEAPDEYVAPHIAGISGNRLQVVDNGKKQFYEISGDSIFNSVPVKASDLMNMPRLADSGQIFFLAINENGPYLGVLKQDRSESEMVMNLSDIDPDISNLSFDIYGNKIVITSSGADRAVIFDLDSRNVIDMSGNEKASFYYSDVKCGPDSFFLLSQRDINENTMEGTSAIEEYSYDGTPKTRYVLDFMGSIFLLDNKKDRFILMSPMDENYHIVNK